MKIAVTGKGGVGKSTVVGLLARALADDGWKVLALDADPDANLASAIIDSRNLTHSARVSVLMSMSRRLEIL